MTRGSPRKKSTTLELFLKNLLLKRPKNSTFVNIYLYFSHLIFCCFFLESECCFGEKKRKRKKGKISVHDKPHFVSLLEESGTQSYPSVVWTEFRFGWKTECFHGSSKACDYVNHFSLDFHAC